MKAEQHVIEVKASNLVWGFDDQPPSFSVINGTYTSAESVDPRPAYAHSLELVESELRRTASLFPLPFAVYIYVSHYEGLGRTNAHASPGYDYNAEQVNGEYPISTGTIVLSGKRIPIHPAMTRYLISHEYGHLVEYYLKRAGRLDLDEYSKLRGIPQEQPPYAAGNWHLSRGEIFANDFRILVCRREEEFWPHEVKFPLTLPALVSWWQECTTDLLTAAAADSSVQEIA